MFFWQRTWFRAWSPVILVFAGVSFVLGGAYSLQRFLSPPKNQNHPVLFSGTFPVAPEYHRELTALRKSGRLNSQDEANINYAIKTSSDALEIPEALLWCLLFQESRLNHLEGYNEGKSASGIGQFSYFSFYEVNHHLERFTKDNREFMLRWFGRDIRPISAESKHINQPSSYYFIPTGVAASAAYLNNRYHHLAQLLEDQGIAYNPELLWLYAAMAYNKGTRSVLAFWNLARKKGDTELVSRLVSDHKLFLNYAQQEPFTDRALAAIWGKRQGRVFAKELRQHLDSLEKCSIPPTQPRRSGS